MSRVFSFNREFDFIRLDGLRRATGRPPHEWDLYILKELLDNALDADETFWCHDKTNFPAIHIHVEYIPISELRTQQLFIQVSNRMEFPVAQLENIFDTGWYTSRKAFIKGLTRGALGNALKTLLGIPYALRHRVAGDWSPALKPLSIRCGEMEYLPRYLIDSLAQTVKFDYEKKKRSRVSGTVISLGLDHFEQERPRTIEDIALLALQYHLCNPHVQFSWSVSIDGCEWMREYAPDGQWTSKFCGPAPIHWYEPTAFQDVLGSLYRKQFGEKDDGVISLERIYQSFVPPNRTSALAIEQTFGKQGMTAAEIEGPAATQLYHLLLRNSRRVDLLQPGRIGAEHVCRIIAEALPVKGDVFYTYQTSDDLDMPFVVEVAAAYVEEGKRQLWTAINYTPTYGDPFQSRYLRPPLLADDQVLGLRGFLDAYGMTEETPILLFLHLISPKIEHHDFSKTEINHLPFRKALGVVLDRLLTTLKQAQEEEELQLQETVHQIVEAIFRAVETNERFVMDQLLEKVRLRLQDYAMYAQWLNGPGAFARLQAAILDYLGKNALLAQKFARTTAGTVTIPLHPDRHFTLAAEHLSQEVLSKHHANKILYIQERALEAVAIENRWLCRMDMALLHNPATPEALQDALTACLMKCDVPILIWHNADEQGRELSEQIKMWLEKKTFDISRVIDLGLPATTTGPMRLLEMMPGEQLAWLLQRFKEQELPVKALPSTTEIPQDISARFEKLLFGRFLERLVREMAHDFSDLDQQLQITRSMIEQQLDREVKHRLDNQERFETYSTVAERVVEEFFRELTHRHGATLQAFLQHIRLLRTNDGGD